MDAKNIRLNRILKNGKMFCVPLDHGITNGPIGRIKDFSRLASDIVDNGATALVVHRGMIRLLPQLNSTGIIVHLSASTDMYVEVNKILVCTVEDAIRSGADAVSIHVNVGNSYEKRMIKDLAYVSRQCEYYGIPLMAMMYVRNDLNADFEEIDKVIHSIQIASELGVDIVKIPHVQEINKLRDIVNLSPIPLVVAGGIKYSNENELFNRTAEIMKQGVMGISYGRNIFEAANSAMVMKKLKEIVLINASL